MKRKFKNIFRIIILSLSLIYIAVLIIYMKNLENKPTILYNKYFTHDVLINKRSDRNIKAIYYYSNNQFDKALIEFENLLSNDSSSAYQLYYAITLMKLERFEESENILIKVINKNDIYCEKAQWYLALNYLVNDIDKSKEFFTLMSNETEHFKNKESIYIIKSLK